MYVNLTLLSKLHKALATLGCMYKAKYTGYVTVYIRDCIDVLDCEKDELATSAQGTVVEDDVERRAAEKKAIQQTWDIVQRIQQIVKEHKLTANRDLRRMINDHLNELEGSHD